MYTISITGKSTESLTDYEIDLITTLLDEIGLVEVEVDCVGDITDP